MTGAPDMEGLGYQIGGKPYRVRHPDAMAAAPPAHSERPAAAMPPLAWCLCPLPPPPSIGACLCLQRFTEVSIFILLFGSMVGQMLQVCAASSPPCWRHAGRGAPFLGGGAWGRRGHVPALPIAFLSAIQA